MRASRQPCAASARGASTTADLYEDVTRRIVADLEAGRFPWVQPWGVQPWGAPDGGPGSGGALAPGLPRNALTGRAYSGVNILLLWGAVMAGGYPSQGWLTFRQALQAGGCVRKGERGVTAVYADRFVPKGKTERAAREQDEARGVPFLKRFTLFNVAQCDGLDPRLVSDPVPPPECETVAEAEAVIAASGADFRIGGAKAFYAPGADFIAVPPRPAFFAPIDYYRTALHELTHWTGHKTRLARDQSGAFGSQAYAREELAAEMGSAFLCAALGVVPTVRHADYLASWLDVLRADARAIFRAASAASKAADYLLAPRHSPGCDEAAQAAERPDPGMAEGVAA